MAETNVANGTGRQAIPKNVVSTLSIACDLPKPRRPPKQEKSSPASLIRGCGLLLIWNKRGPFSTRWMMRTNRSGERARAKEGRPEVIKRTWRGLCQYVR